VSVYDLEGKLSQTQRVKLDWAWHTLRDANVTRDEPITAGELGRTMGISRNTAKRYLDIMVVFLSVRVEIYEAKNHHPQSMYWAISPED